MSEPGSGALITDLAPPVLLRATPTSPFGRKVRIALRLAGLDGQVEEVAASPLDAADPIRRDNPVGKMPCLLLANGETVFDSPVILEYIDLFGATRLIPVVPAARIAALRQQALADGIADAAVLMGSERMFHPVEHLSQKWLDHQRGKVERGLAAFERALPDIAPIDIGAISLACMLGYLDWRKPVEWRETYPGLVAWLDAFRAAVPAFDATAAPD
ncbi:glutathione S-transferase family protein [Novosphingobium sp. BL-52-GroH]|uniref:glutathione S-transferase family protein n=1 Tax=Novosphingobium sp. BL-52-GroH TaxID=3349877 RepID=UPI003851630E